MRQLYCFAVLVATTSYPDVICCEVSGQRRRADDSHPLPRYTSVTQAKPPAEEWKIGRDILFTAPVGW